MWNKETGTEIMNIFNYGGDTEFGVDDEGVWYMQDTYGRPRNWQGGWDKTDMPNNLSEVPTVAEYNKMDKTDQSMMYNQAMLGSYKQAAEEAFNKGYGFDETLYDAIADRQTELHADFMKMDDRSEIK